MRRSKIERERERERYRLGYRLSGKYVFAALSIQRMFHIFIYDNHPIIYIISYNFQHIHTHTHDHSVINRVYQRLSSLSDALLYNQLRIQFHTFNYSDSLTGKISLTTKLFNPLNDMFERDIVSE